jgi:hypothetical protein
VVGQQGGAEHQQQHDPRHGHQEHGAPPEVLEQHATDERAERRPAHEAGQIDGEGAAALLLVGEHGGDQGQHRRHHRGTRHAEQRTADDEHLRAGRERRRHRSDPERGGADQQQFLSADPVTDGAHGDQEACDQEAVDVHDPQLLDAARCEVGGQVRNGQVQHGEIHRDEEGGQAEHGQPDPFPPPGSGPRMCRVHDPLLS